MDTKYMDKEQLRPFVSKRNFDEVKTLTGVIRGDFDEALTVMIKEYRKALKVPKDWRVSF